MSHILRIRDESGRGMDAKKFEDVIMPTQMDIPLKLKRIKEFAYKEGDVFVCAYPKSGNHWMSAIVYLLQQATSLNDVRSLKLPNLPLIDFYSLRKIGAQRVPRTLASHLKYGRLSEQFRSSHGGKIVLVLRNPKDVAVSFFHHLKNHVDIRNEQSWDHFLKCFATGEIMNGSIFDYLDSWQETISEKRRPPILIVYYEDLVQDIFKELTRISHYLDYAHSDEVLRAIADRCSYGNMQRDISTGKMTSVLRNADGESILLRKGRVGDWRNHFSDEQNRAFDKVCCNRLKQSIFKFRYDNEAAGTASSKL